LFDYLAGCIVTFSVLLKKEELISFLEGGSAILFFDGTLASHEKTCSQYGFVCFNLGPKSIQLATAKIQHSRVAAKSKHSFLSAVH
jgi:hypothetical protein